MLSGSMTYRRGGIAAAPRQDGSTSDEQIARADQPTTESCEDAQHEKRLGQGCAGYMASLARLGSDL